PSPSSRDGSSSPTTAADTCARSVPTDRWPTTPTRLARWARWCHSGSTAPARCTCSPRTGSCASIPSGEELAQADALRGGQILAEARDRCEAERVVEGACSGLVVPHLQHQFPGLAGGGLGCQALQDRPPYPASSGIGSNVHPLHLRPTSVQHPHCPAPHRPSVEAGDEEGAANTVHVVGFEPEMAVVGGVEVVEKGAELGAKRGRFRLEGRGRLENDRSLIHRRHVTPARSRRARSTRMAVQPATSASNGS